MTHHPLTPDQARAHARSRFEHAVQAGALLRAAEELMKQAQWHAKHAGSSYQEPAIRGLRAGVWTALYAGGAWENALFEETKLGLGAKPDA